MSTYAQITTVNADGTNVTMKGEKNLVYLAIWTGGGYTYSISIQAGSVAVGHIGRTAQRKQASAHHSFLRGRGKVLVYADSQLNIPFLSRYSDNTIVPGNSLW